MKVCLLRLIITLSGLLEDWCLRVYLELSISISFEGAVDENRHLVSVAGLTIIPLAFSYKYTSWVGGVWRGSLKIEPLSF